MQAVRAGLWRGGCLRAIAAAIWLWTASTTAALADVYTFEPGLTNITFSWDHLGLSRQSGRILKYEGFVKFDPLEPERASIDVALSVPSISTGIPAFDTDLRSPDFFDAARYPAITFRSTAVRKTGDKTADVEGNLTIRGISQPVVLQVRWNYTGEHPLAKINPTYSNKFVSGFSARTSILRSAFDMSRGVPLVSDEIIITIETELVRKGGEP